MHFKPILLVPAATLLVLGVAPKEALAVSYGVGTWNAEGTPDWTIAPTASQTCFLNGIGGEFGGSPGEYTDPFTEPVNSTVSVVAIDSATGKGCTNLASSTCNWVFQDRNGGGTGIGGGVTCLYGQVTNRCQATWDGVNYQDGSCPAHGSNTRCFLTAVSTSGELWEGSYNGQQPASVTITGPANGQFTISAQDADYGYDSSYASMVCLDIQDLSGSWGFRASGPPSGTSTFQLRNSYNPNGALVPTANVACGLTGITGNWMSAPGSLGWNDGAIANAPKGGFWDYDLSNGRGAEIACVE